MPTSKGEGVYVEGEGVHIEGTPVRFQSMLDDIREQRGDAHGRASTNSGIIAAVDSGLLMAGGVASLTPILGRGTSLRRVSLASCLRTSITGDTSAAGFGGGIGSS